MPQPPRHSFSGIGQGASPRPMRRTACAVLLLGVAPLSGCYTNRQIMAAPSPGSTVVLDLNDRARVQLGDRIGPSVASIQGVVQTGSDTGYVLNISSVRYLNGQSNQWSGERFTISPGLVTQAWQRQFSRSKTTALGLGIAAALLAAVLSTDLFGESRGTPPVTPPPPVGGT